MAKYEVTYSCGHTEKRSLGGEKRVKDWKFMWYKNCDICRACRRKITTDVRSDVGIVGEYLHEYLNIRIPCIGRDDVKILTEYSQAFADEVGIDAEECYHQFKHGIIPIGKDYNLVSVPGKGLRMICEADMKWILGMMMEELGI